MSCLEDILVDILSLMTLLVLYPSSLGHFLFFGTI
jgi:hypothetical protein